MHLRAVADGPQLRTDLQTDEPIEDGVALLAARLTDRPAQALQSVRRRGPCL